MPRSDAPGAHRPWVPLLAVALVASAGFALINGQFLTGFNVYVILSSATLLALIGFSQLTVLAVGEFSLAVGSIGSLVGVATGHLLVTRGLRSPRRSRPASPSASGAGWSTARWWRPRASAASSSRSPRAAPSRHRARRHRDRALHRAAAAAERLRHRPPRPTAGRPGARPPGRVVARRALRLAAGRPHDARLRRQPRGGPSVRPVAGRRAALGARPVGPVGRRRRHRRHGPAPRGQPFGGLGLADPVLHGADHRRHAADRRRGVDRRHPGGEPHPRDHQRRTHPGQRRRHLGDAGRGRAGLRGGAARPLAGPRPRPLAAERAALPPGLDAPGAA